MDKIWNFGIVGSGVIADFHAKAIQHISNAKLIGVCGKSGKSARILSDKYGCLVFENYQELLSNPEIDIVTIATPSGLHMEPTIEAAKKGKHVLCEKPIEITLDRIDAMIEAHQKSGTYLGGIFNYRYTDVLAPLKNAIDTGRFGVITHASVYVPWWRSDDYYEGNWRGTWELDGGGALMNQSIHMIDMLQYLMGPITSIKSFSATLAHPQIEAEDSSVSALQFENNALGVIYGTTGAWPGQARRLEIMGTKGTVVQEDDNIIKWEFADKIEGDEEILANFGNDQGVGGASDPTAIPFVNHQRNIEEFIQAIETESPFSIDGYEARKAVEIILRIYKSSGIKH